eukprot:3136314-Amphidinium_carterae.1
MCILWCGLRLALEFTPLGGAGVEPGSFGVGCSGTRGQLCAFMPVKLSCSHLLHMLWYTHKNYSCLPKRDGAWGTGWDVVFVSAEEAMIISGVVASMGSRLGYFKIGVMPHAEIVPSEMTIQA